MHVYIYIVRNKQTNRIENKSRWKRNTSSNNNSGVAQYIFMWFICLESSNINSDSFRLCINIDEEKKYWESVSKQYKSDGRQNKNKKPKSLIYAKAMCAWCWCIDKNEVKIYLSQSIAQSMKLMCWENPWQNKINPFELLLLFYASNDRNAQLVCCPSPICDAICLIVMLKQQHRRQSSVTASMTTTTWSIYCNLHTRKKEMHRWLCNYSKLASFFWCIFEIKLIAIVHDVQWQWCSLHGKIRTKSNVQIAFNWISSLPN